MYYYGARYYDPRLSIFISVDPLAEKTMTPYQYVSNNPIMRIDPTGMEDHDYTLNKETGRITLVRNTNDDFDRILVTDDKGKIEKHGTGFLVPKDKKGKEKVAVDNIPKGILKNNMNFKRISNTFSVNGKDEPTLKEFDKFISEFTDYLGKEIAGVRLGNDTKDKNVTSVKIYKYMNNTRDKSSTPKSWFTDFGDRLKSHFHTHPYHDHVPSDQDKQIKTDYPNLQFYIISGGYEKQY